MANYSDNFTYADGPLADQTAWDDAWNAGCAVVSNEVNGDFPAGNLASIVAAATANFGADGEAEIEFATNPLAGDNGGVVYRWSGTSGYLSYADPNFVFLAEVSSGTITQLVTASATALVAGNKLKLKCAGTTISVEVDTGSGFTEILSVTDSTHATGQPGVFYGYGNINATRIDNFAAVDTVPAGPNIVSVDSDNTVVVGDVEPTTYDSFTTGIETATINDGGTATTDLTVSNVTGTTADLQLASMSAWVGLKACPFTSTSQTGQQVTVTNTDEAESASLAVTFNPPSGNTVIETNGMTWPAPDGSILKGFASQPPANSQIIHPNGLNIAADGIVTTDLTTNQTCYFYNETTEEGSSFQWLIESGGASDATGDGIFTAIQPAITSGITKVL